MMFAERFDLYWLISGAVLQGSTHKKEKKERKALVDLCRLYGAGGGWHLLSGVCSKLVNQLSRVSR